MDQETGAAGPPPDTAEMKARFVLVTSNDSSPELISLMVKVSLSFILMLVCM